MNSKKTYPAFIFKQRPDSPLQVVFVAPSNEIDSWARVPTKRTGNIRNFQRAQIDSHVKEVERFFTSRDNASPTAVVIGFDPIRSRNQIVTRDGENKIVKPTAITSGEPLLGSVEISWARDEDPQTQDELVSSILTSHDLLQDYVYDELLDITHMDRGALDRLAKVFNERAITGELIGLEDDDETDEEVDVDQNTDTDSKRSEISSELVGLSPSERQVVIGRLLFLSQLQEDFLRGMPIESLKEIYREVRDELKPGILIDGQHRIMGTKNLGDIPFLVTALPGANWPELAFQFIVTNRTARRVAESLLISIVGNSLSNQQRSEIEERLRRANIRVGLIEAVMQVHEDEQSPFYGMLAFGLKQEKGFIDAAAMRGKVVQLWYERKPPVRELFDHYCLVGRTQAEKTEYWQSEQLWFELFIAFWSAVKVRYEGSEVFSPELADNRREPASRLMTATVLKIFQETVLGYLLDFLQRKEVSEEVPIESSIPNANAFSVLVERTLKPLVPEFFVGWKLTGFDGSKGARDDLADAIEKLISKEKTLSQLKRSHRLFRAEE